MRHGDAGELAGDGADPGEEVPSDGFVVGPQGRLGELAEELQEVACRSCVGMGALCGKLREEDVQSFHELRVAPGVVLISPSVRQSELTHGLRWIVVESKVTR